MGECGEVQDIARQAMDITRASLCPGQTLRQVRDQCEAAMRDLGADSFWYWDIGAFIFAGPDTVLSISGRDYQTADKVLGDDELITLDLSPQRDGTWGDFARTLIIEDGQPLYEPSDTSNSEWREGIRVEHKLHALLVDTATPDMTFEKLADIMNTHINQLGYENLDFLGNLGHSIARRSTDRIYIERGNQAPLDSVDLLTFEPHIRRTNGSFGYKHENIYRFSDGRLQEI